MNKTYNTMLHDLLTLMGFEEMESGVYRKNNIDILIQVIEHNDNLS